MTCKTTGICKVTLLLFLTFVAALVWVPWCSIPDSDQPRRTITIKPMHTVAKKQQGALTVISLMFVGAYSSFYEVHSHDSFSLLTYISFEKTGAKCIFRMNNGNKRDTSTSTFPFHASCSSSSLM